MAAITAMRSAIFVAILLGLAIPHLASALTPLMIPILMVMMVISMSGIRIMQMGSDTSWRLLTLMLLQYGILSGLIIALTALFVPPEHQSALYILALMPPAAGAVSLAYLFGGNLQLSFLAEAVAYLASMLIIPLMTLVLFGDMVDPVMIFMILAFLIIVPFLVSRSIGETLLTNANGKLAITVCYGILAYIVVGANKHVLLTNAHSLIPVVFVLVTVKFGLSYVLYRIFMRAPRDIGVLYVLFGTLKTGASAIAITVLLFGIEAAAPLAVHAMLVPFHILFLEWIILRSA